MQLPEVGNDSAGTRPVAELVPDVLRDGCDRVSLVSIVRFLYLLWCQNRAAAGLERHETGNQFATAVLDRTSGRIFGKWNRLSRAAARVARDASTDLGWSSRCIRRAQLRSPENNF